MGPESPLQHSQKPATRVPKMKHSFNRNHNLWTLKALLPRLREPTVLTCHGSDESTVLG